MKNYLYCIMLFCLAGCQMQYKPLFNENVALDYCYSQVNRALKDLVDSNGTYNYSMMPRNILPGDTTWNCRQASSQEWCSGFWPGILWMTYDYTKDKDIKKVAKGYTDALRFLSSQPIYDHDIGFITINSLMKGYEATGREDYKKCALAAADSLATLYNSHVGTILSWPRHVKDYGGHNTIMDNIMNLELLFWAAKNGGDKRLYNIAVSHSDTTMRYQFRPDGSCYHVAVYDTLTGNFIKGVTHQGYSDSSMWSRGQAWAIYGYTMVYRFTHEQRFLEHAKKVADIYLKRLNETSNDMIPIWDMDDPRGLDAPKDASTACIVACALLELCQYVDKEKGEEYRSHAFYMMRDLSTDLYQSQNKNVAFLMHSTGHHPAGSEIDASIIYADYYYLEALLRIIGTHKKI